MAVHSAGKGRAHSSRDLGGRPPTAGSAFSYTRLLMGYEGANGSTAFVDESPRARPGVGFSTNAAISTAQFKFGASSLGLDGADDWVTFPASPDWYFGTGSFGIDAWVRPSSVAGSKVIIGQSVDLNAGAVGSSWCLYMFSGGLYFMWYDPLINDWRSVTGGSAIPVDTWTHVAVDRDAKGMVRLYIGGAMVGSYALGAGPLRQVPAMLTIGAAGDGSGDFAGWIDEVRIVKGIAPWGSDAGFAVPVAPYPRA